MIKLEVENRLVVARDFQGRGEGEVALAVKRQHKRFFFFGCTVWLVTS